MQAGKFFDCEIYFFSHIQEQSFFFRFKVVSNHLNMPMAKRARIIKSRKWVSIINGSVPKAMMLIANIVSLMENTRNAPQMYMNLVLFFRVYANSEAINNIPANKAMMICIIL